MSLPGLRTAPVFGPFSHAPVVPAVTALVPHERRNSVGRQALRSRVAAEFIEMPGLRLTLAQAWRLFGLRSDVCLRVLGELSTQGVLRRTADGQFARRDS
ncbi:MAG TPA: hypothetical protein VD833_08415 [Vicinamibacterales bacterium]|nr:hypothetical protein [Vicinamibacterales bacterium]